MEENSKKIVVRPNGSYVVSGNIPLVRKRPILTEDGEPVGWEKTETLPTEETYKLCRCGLSQEKPFCDGSHRRQGFDGTERADTNLTAERQVTLKSGQKLVVRRDYSLCMDAGFCGNRFTNIDKMAADLDDTAVLSQIIAMVERCPSGSYTYSLSEGKGDNEPDLAEQIAVVTEFTADGPIMGPLWVTGNIPIERADGQPFETRNRVTLCRCGLSKIKPLCDGTHRQMRCQE